MTETIVPKKRRKKNINSIRSISNTRNTSTEDSGRKVEIKRKEIVLPMNSVIEGIDQSVAEVVRGTKRKRKREKTILMTVNLMTNSTAETMIDLMSILLMIFTGLK